MQTTKPESDLVNAELSRLLGSTVSSIELIHGGRNSRVYRIKSSDEQYVVKFYPVPDGHDCRDRLSVEFSSLRFMREAGISCVPVPVAVSHEHSFAVYGHIDGSPVQSDQVTAADIDLAVDFLVQLNQLTDKYGSDALPLASEARFCADGVVQDIQTRLDRLLAQKQEEESYRKMKVFLADDFAPAFSRIEDWSRSASTQSGVAFDRDIPNDERTISPSDFGFHNAVRRPDGAIVFIDFEYFGWDDPAKLISDFLLHPGMGLDSKLKKRFADSMLARLDSFSQLPQRVEAVYPLFGLKWCLILLNEFVPTDLRRRRASSGNTLDVAAVQAEQLEKSRNLLQQIEREYEHFFYHD